jgi:hypothetical protein
MSDKPVINVGDRIRFRVATRWAGRTTQTRVVNGFVLGDSVDRVTVRFGGHPKFMVRDYEILEVIPQGDSA